jgi:hypothetical protein
VRSEAGDDGKKVKLLVFVPRWLLFAQAGLT